MMTEVKAAPSVTAARKDIYELSTVSPARTLLENAFKNSYNSTNDIQCTIKVNKANHDELEIVLVLKNVGNHSVRLPLTQYWNTNFVLVVYNEYTHEYLTTIRNGHPCEKGDNILLAPGQTLRTSFRDVLSHFDANDLSDVIFVATSVPSDKISHHFIKSIFKTEVDPFTKNFWTETIWKNEQPWKGSSFVSNVLRTSKEFS